MEVHDLVGSKVWVKQHGLAERVGYITAVSKAVDHEDIETSINASTFIILLEKGDFLETEGFNLSKIEHAGFIKERVGTLPIDKTHIVRFKSPEISTDVVVAASVEVHGEDLAFVNSKGELAALYLFEIVESWSELPSTDKSER
jgi:hypothetical protein